jgi:hypothetical protein
MKRITFISAVVATVFMFLALGPTKAQALVNCEDVIFLRVPSWRSIAVTKETKMATPMIFAPLLSRVER